MLDLDGRYMVRIPRWRSGAHSLQREVRLLEYLARHVRTPVPRPWLVGALDEPAGWPFLVYPKLPGTPLNDLTALGPDDKVRLADFLGRLFSELDHCPNGPLRKIGLLPGDPASCTERFERLRRRYRRLGRGRLPTALGARVDQAICDVLSVLEESHYRPGLIHNDLWPSHILWDDPPSRPTGVIDWEDARLGDPAADLTAMEGLGAPLLLRIGERRRAAADRLFWARVALYRRILPLWGFLYGIEVKNRDIANRHLRQLSATLS